MAIIVETGEGLSDANSYLSTDESRELARVRGIAFPCENEDIQKLIYRSMDYIESHESRLSGCRTSDTQALAYPREEAYVGNVALANNVIPKEIKLAQFYTMVGLNEGIDPMANRSSEPFVTREQVDVLRIDYSVESQYNRNRLTMVDKLLSLLTNGGMKVRFIKA